MVMHVFCGWFPFNGQGETIDYSGIYIATNEPLQGTAEMILISHEYNMERAYFHANLPISSLKLNLQLVVHANCRTVCRGMYKFLLNVHFSNKARFAVQNCMKMFQMERVRWEKRRFTGIIGFTKLVLRYTKVLT